MRPLCAGIWRGKGKCVNLPEKRSSKRMNIKTKVFKNRILCPRMAVAITLFGLVFVKDKRKIDQYVLNHEKIHCCQQLEWLYLPFFVLYGIEWLVGICRYGDWDKAYRSISFEREAYAHDSDLDYIPRRRLYANYRKDEGDR